MVSSHQLPSVCWDPLILSAFFFSLSLSAFVNRLFQSRARCQPLEIKCLSFSSVLSSREKEDESHVKSVTSTSSDLEEMVTTSKTSSDMTVTTRLLDERRDNRN